MTEEQQLIAQGPVWKQRITFQRSIQRICLASIDSIGVVTPESVKYWNVNVIVSTPFC